MKDNNCHIIVTDNSKKIIITRKGADDPAVTNILQYIRSLSPRLKWASGGARPRGLILNKSASILIIGFPNILVIHQQSTGVIKLSHRDTLFRARLGHKNCIPYLKLIPFALTENIP